MANNKSIQFLRGSTARGAAVGSSTTLLAGQPFFETDTNRLYVGDGNKTLDVISAINGSYYDLVITNQAEFDVWLSQVSSSTARSVLIVGLPGGRMYNTGGKLICLPDTLIDLVGINNAVISVTTSSQAGNKGAIYYNTTLPDSARNSIRGIHLQFVSGSFVYGFLGCHNLIDCGCTATLMAGSGDVHCFKGCSHLTNCYAAAEATTGNTSAAGFSGCLYLNNCCGDSKTRDNGSAYGFLNCSYLNNCFSTVSADNAAAPTSSTLSGFSGCNQLGQCYATNGTRGNNTYGFNRCSRLGQCYANLTGASGSGTAMRGFAGCVNISSCCADVKSGTLVGYGFDNCINISGCSAVAISSSSAAYGFYNCSGISGCTGDGKGGSSPGAAYYNISRASACNVGTSSVVKWAGTNTYIDTDSCPEYAA